MQPFTTTDISFAAYLRVNNIKLIGIQKVEYSKSQFVFQFDDPTNILHEIEQTFLSGSTSVEPTAFHAQVKQLSMLIKKAQQ